MVAGNHLMSDMSPFSLFEIEPAYTLNWDAVESKKSLFQKTLHPDLFPTGSSECEFATEKMALMNNAYLVLKDPIHRARTLLELKKISIPGENGTTICDPKLMDDALALKESLEEASINNDFSTFFETLAEQQKILEGTFNNAFLENDEHKMKEAYIRLSFCIKTLTDAKTLCFKNMGN